MREVCGEEVVSAVVGLIDMDAVKGSFLGSVVWERVPV